MGWSTIGSDQIEPNGDRSSIMGNGYQDIRTDAGNYFNIDVNNPRFNVASSLTSAIGTAAVFSEFGNQNPESTGWNRTPATLQDQMTLDAAKDGAGYKIIDNLGDPNFQGMEKWEYKVKSAEGADSVVHYVRDPNTGELMDFKFKAQSNDKPTPAEKTTAPTSPTGNQ